jgi:hypothetical protein
MPYLLFPLDQRWIYYEQKSKLLNRRRPELWDNLKDNEFLVTVPEPRKVSEAKPLLARTLVDLHVHDRGSVCIPRELRAGDLVTRPAANLSQSAWTAIRDAWRLRGSLEGKDARDAVATLFQCALAVIYAPAYGYEHRSALSADWARIPIPRDHSAARRLEEVGRQVSALLDPSKSADDVVSGILGAKLMRELGSLKRSGGGPIQPSDLRVEISYFGAAKGKYVLKPDAIGYGEPIGDLFINRTAAFENVPESAWQFELGGYPILRKWLGYRQVDRHEDRPLTLDEARHFRSMVQRLSALAAISSDLDDAYRAAVNGSFTVAELGLL